MEEVEPGDEDEDEVEAEDDEEAALLLPLFPCLREAGETETMALADHRWRASFFAISPAYWVKNSSCSG